MVLTILEARTQQ